MNPLQTTAQNSFRSGTDNLSSFAGHLIRIDNGAVLFCEQGEATVTLNLKQYRLFPNTSMIMLPNSVLSLTAASTDFSVRYFAFSEGLFKAAGFRIEPPFFRHLKNNPCHVRTEPQGRQTIRSLIQLAEIAADDTENRFREAIAQHLLQIFFLDTYDKVQRLLAPGQANGYNRKEELFKQFIDLTHTYCTSQRDVGFYAQRLCISPRYLSSITQQMGQNSAKNIIDEMLMLELKVALQSTTLSMKEIAEKYHFPDQSFFGRYFKKHTGMSPKEFRARNA